MESEKEVRQTGNKKTLFEKLGKHPVLIITSICSICFAIIAGLFAFIQIDRYEDGILEVCATQQDAYVQLVLDQINLKDNRDDEQIIKDILGTMDASSNHYWTFSKDQSMLFVKDVTETNKYKGVTTATYYVSDSAKEFLNNLSVNNVIHSYIEINDNSYIASGVMFEYKGGTYRLCLLTEKDVLLDNNAYLGVRTQMQTFVVVILLLLVVVPMLFAHFVRKMQFNTDKLNESLLTVNTIMSKMSQKLTERDLHDTRNNMWHENVLEQFFEKIKKRNIYPVTALHIGCKDKNMRDEFIAKAHYILDKNVLRFEYKDSDVILIFIKINEESALKSVEVLTSEDVKILNHVLVNQSTRLSDITG